jgi:hypothetical protein
MWLKACGCNRLAIATFLNPTRSGGDEGGWNGSATVYEAVFDELESARPLAVPRFLSTNTAETAFGIRAKHIAVVGFGILRIGRQPQEGFNR